MTAKLAFVALAETGPEDAEPTENIAFLDLPVAKVNVADDPAVRDHLMQLWSTVREVKVRRSQLEEEWLAIQRMIVLEHDDGKKYNGRSNAYLPTYARARKTLISALSKGLFPSDEYMDVVDRENGESEKAKAVKEVIRYEFEVSARLRSMIKPFLGQFVDFGFAVMKRWYRTDKIVKPKRRRVTTAQVPTNVVQYDEGFTVSNRSVFNVVVYPEWAEEKRDLTLEAERLEFPVSYVETMASSKRWLNVTEALNTGSTIDNFDWANQETLADVSSIPNVTQFRAKSGSPVSSVTAVEVWHRMVLPTKLYAPDEDNTLPAPTRTLFVNGVPVVCRRNDFHNQESPLEYARDNLVAGSFYGSGAGRATRYLQYLINDFANQTNDVGIYGLNPITLVNTNYFSGSMDSLRPGRTYRVRDVDKAIKFIKPEVEIIQYGQTLLQQHITMAQDGSGAPPVLQGSKAASTATGTQLLSQNAQSPLQDTVEDIEVQVMVPLMKAAWELAVQYRNKPFLRTLTGESVSILPSDIDIDAEFRYLASSQAISRSARQQGLAAFTQLLQPLLPLLQVQGKMVDPTIILQKAWSDGLGNRGFDKLIVPMPMPGAQPPGVGAGPGVAPPSSGPPPEAVAQGGVMPPEDVGPQSDTFADIRNQSNAVTGPMGSIPPGLDQLG